VPAFQGAIFDVDGVLVDSPHEKAWRESLRELMEGEWSDIRDRTTSSPEAFTRQVYETQMSGKPRMSGARAALGYFRVPVDEDEHRLVQYADRKQKMVVRLIEAGDFTAYPDALRFIIAVTTPACAWRPRRRRRTRSCSCARSAPMRSPASAGSRRRRRATATLLEFFDADVSGRDFAHGKPHPEMFLTAAEELGVEPGAAIVMEDAPAGVQAAKAGGMAAIGIARADDAALLAEAAADVVVSSLDEVDLAALAGGRLVKREA
jgi:beta-phosphoglucomutase